MIVINFPATKIQSKLSRITLHAIVTFNNFSGIPTISGSIQAGLKNYENMKNGASPRKKVDIHIPSN